MRGARAERCRPNVQRLNRSPVVRVPVLHVGLSRRPTGETCRHKFAVKKPRLAARKIVRTRCLQFAARLVVRVNVRALQDSQGLVKCLARRGLPGKRTKRPVMRGARLHHKPLNQQRYFNATPPDRRLIPHKRFHRRAFPPVLIRDEAQNRPLCLRLAATRLKFAATPGRLRPSAGHALQLSQTPRVFV